MSVRKREGSVADLSNISPVGPASHSFIKVSLQITLFSKKNHNYIVGILTKECPVGQGTISYGGGRRDRHYPAIRPSR